MHGNRGLRMFRDQGGFVAKPGGVQLALAGPGALPDVYAIAAADDARPPAARLQGLRPCNRERCFAGAASIDIAEYPPGQGAEMDLFGGVFTNGRGSSRERVL